MKIVTPEEMPSLCDRLRAAGGTIVFTHGVFDLLQPDHIDALMEAGAQGTHLIVALWTDHATERIYGKKRPVVPLAERAEVLAELEMVTAVTWFKEESPDNLLSVLKPDVIIGNIDDAAGHLRIVNKIIQLPGASS
jgi:rfaE bifunctional protein nucleotidyltransferase chain/domain